MGTIWSTFTWAEKFNDGLCIHFLRLCGLKSSCNSSRLINRSCERTLTSHVSCFLLIFCTRANSQSTEQYLTISHFLIHAVVPVVTAACCRLPPPCSRTHSLQADDLQMIRHSCVPIETHLLLLDRSSSCCRWSDVVWKATDGFMDDCQDFV